MSIKNIKTPEQLQDEAAIQADESKAAEAQRKAQDLIIKEQVESKLDTLSDEDYDTLSLVFDRWEPDTPYAVDEKVRWKSVLYKVVQAHTSQADWTPDATPSLFTPYRDPAAGPQPWVQPTGAQDAYSIGERVTHDNPNDGGNIWVYESAIDANTVEPGRDGEFDRYWTPIGLPASPA